MSRKFVIKRNGKEVDYDKNKIFNAIFAAVEEVYPNNDRNEIDSIRYSKEVESWIDPELIEDGIKVEDIQDIVEEVLMKEDVDVARAYIRYRYKREIARDTYTILMNELNEKISAKKVVNQNANVDEKSFGGRMGETADLVAKRIALDYYVSPMARENHEGNMIYIHDLSAYAVGSHNCLSIPFDDLLAKGFNTRQTDVRPAQSINTAFQLVAVIFQLQSLNQFGGVSATHIDWTMIPYVRKSFSKHFKDGIKYFLKDNDPDRVPDELSFNDHEANDEHYKDVYQYAMDMTIKETYQAVEGMYHNLNTLQSRSGNQLPFTSINYGTCTEPEGRLVTKALLEVSLRGIGKLHKTSIFPCGIFQSMKNVNQKPGDPNYDLFQLALKSTSLRLYPNYANVDWSGNAGYDINDPRTYFSTINKTVA